MKATNILFTLSLVLASSLASHAQVGIGTSSPNATAALDITSTTQGFLPPRMTAAQRDAITTPAQGLMIFCTDCGANGEPQYYNSAWINLSGTSGPCGLVVTTVVDVTNPTTGKIWMDRNLGAAQAATSSTDASSYGDLYQWGRRSDGHQCRNSVTTTTLSSADTPAHGYSILAPNSPYDWRSPQNTNLWQGVNGINNPCPSGYRLPTETELNAERLSWGPVNSTGAFASPLKLPMAGYRAVGSLFLVGTGGLYWSSSVSGADSTFLLFFSSNAYMNAWGRASGISVRCLKD